MAKTKVVCVKFLLDRLPKIIQIG